MTYPLEITAQLLLHGIAKVIIVARSADKFKTAREAWSHRDGISLGENDARIEFISCDLSNIIDVQAAARQIKQMTDRIHMLFCNAGLGVPYEYKRSPQNIDRVFAANCVGHQALSTMLLPLLKNAVPSAHHGVRIVVTSSSLHSVCQQLDLDLLTSPSRVKWPPLFDSVWRYGRSKLGNILFAQELSRRLLQDPDPACKHIYVNSFFPGNIVTDQWTSWNSYFGSFIGSLMRFTASHLGQSAEEGAATALFLGASDEVQKTDSRGRYFIPIATPCDPSPIGKDIVLARELFVCYARHRCLHSTY